MPERPDRRRPPDLLSSLDRIRDAGDRRHSVALAELFVSRRLDDERAAEVAETLVALEDPRCVPALVDAVHDPRQSFVVRAGAVEILSATPADDPPVDLSRRRAQEHDPFVRALGVQYLDVPDAALVAAAVTDPEPLVRRVATESLAGLVRTPPLVTALRVALRDDDACVREVACRVALLDEPIEASWDLLRALADPSAAVRSAAIDALEWFPRVSVLLALADARTGDSATDAAGAALDALGSRVLVALQDASAGARRRLERWAGPVAWLLDEQRRRRRASPAAEPADETEPVTAPRQQRIDLDLAEAVLTDDDAPPALQRELLTRRSWVRTGRRGLDVLRACSGSTNWALRQMAARPLARCGAASELAALARDREPVVRRSALAASLEMRDGAGPEFLAAARAALADPRARPTVGDHALAVVAANAPPDELAETVADELSRPDDRDGTYLGAIHLARMANVQRAVPALLSIVHAPVAASVAAHVAALQALRSLGHPRTRVDLRHLDGVDHLDVQRELGEWGWHGPRFG